MLRIIKGCVSCVSGDTEWQQKSAFLAQDEPLTPLKPLIDKVQTLLRGDVAPQASQTQDFILQIAADISLLEYAQIYDSMVGESWSIYAVLMWK